MSASRPSYFHSAIPWIAALRLVWIAACLALFLPHAVSVTCPFPCEHGKTDYSLSSVGSHRLRYVPNPSPSVFRTTKNNHNILQGVAPPTLRLTQEQKDNFDAWILKNGLRWTAEGGPLAPGGVNVAFIGARL